MMMSEGVKKFLGRSARRSLGAFFLIALLSTASAQDGDSPTSQPSSQPTSASPDSPSEVSQDKARLLLRQMIEVIGRMDDLKQMRDVEYTYTYRDNASGKADVSLERYVFDGEYSWAHYLKHEKIVLPGQPGDVIQGYDGQNSWVTVDGNPQSAGMTLKLGDFLRKTNYYWFTMMQKLMDPGIIYSHEGTRQVDGVYYDLVRITFASGVGDAQDTYLLYINPVTHLVDQFLFTVMDFRRAVPSLMKVDYEKFGDVMLPTHRRYTNSNWEGEVAPDAVWTEEICENLKFNNGFTRDMFQLKPSETPPGTPEPAATPAP